MDAFTPQLPWCLGGSQPFGWFMLFFSSADEFWTSSIVRNPWYVIFQDVSEECPRFASVKGTTSKLDGLVRLVRYHDFLGKIILNPFHPSIHPSMHTYIHACIHTHIHTYNIYIYYIQTSKCESPITGWLRKCNVWRWTSPPLVAVWPTMPRKKSGGIERREVDGTGSSGWVSLTEVS